MVVKVGQRWRRVTQYDNEDFIIEICRIDSRGYEPIIYSKIVQTFIPFNFSSHRKIGDIVNFNNHMEQSYDPEYTYLVGQDKEQS
jgi:hypothetical protein